MMLEAAGVLAVVVRADLVVAGGSSKAVTSSQPTTILMLNSCYNLR
jgi:hypothetical protein